MDQKYDCFDHDKRVRGNIARKSFIGFMFGSFICLVFFFFLDSFLCTIFMGVAKLI